MRVAIVTPFHAETVVQLMHCIRSVANQFLDSSHTCEHVLVADGTDPRVAAEAMQLLPIATARFPKIIVLPVAHADFGNCARAVGALDAISRGFDAIGFLDGDNWLEPTHVAAMLDLHMATGAPVCTARRTICRVDGTRMYEDGESDGVSHVDTNCLFLTREAFYLLPLWAQIPRSHAAFGDRVFWYATIHAPLERAHSRRCTVNYRSRYAAHYRAIPEEPPPQAKENAPLPEKNILLRPITLLVPGTV